MLAFHSRSSIEFAPSSNFLWYSTHDETTTLIQPDCIRLEYFCQFRGSLYTLQDTFYSEKYHITRSTYRSYPIPLYPWELSAMTYLAARETNCTTKFVGVQFFLFQISFRFWITRSPPRIYRRLRTRRGCYCCRKYFLETPCSRTSTWTAATNVSVCIKHLSSISIAAANLFAL